TVHESFLPSPRAAVVRLARGKTSVVKRAAISAGNGDLSDVAGHGVMVTATSNDCPAGLIGGADFDGLTAGNQITASRPTGGTKKGKLVLNGSAANVTTRSLRSPTRCVAVLNATGPAGDTDATNNTAWMVVDIIDRNDF